MTVTNKISIHMDDRRVIPAVDAVQCDANTRVLEVTLLSGGTAWEVPSGKKVSVAYRKSDGTSGWYDKLPNKAAACSVSGNVVSATLAPQVLTAAGPVRVAVVIQDPDTLDQIAAFPIELRVARNPAAGKGISNDYYNYKTLGDMNEALSGFEDTLDDFESTLDGFGARQDRMKSLYDTLGVVEFGPIEQGAPGIDGKTHNSEHSICAERLLHLGANVSYNVFLKEGWLYTVVEYDDETYSNGVQTVRLVKNPTFTTTKPYARIRFNYHPEENQWPEITPADFDWCCVFQKRDNAAGIRSDTPESLGVLNAILNAKQCREVLYTPIKNLPKNQKKETGDDPLNGKDPAAGYPEDDSTADEEEKAKNFVAGERVKGLPYSSTRYDQLFVPNNVSLYTFMSALCNPNSLLYTVRLDEDESTPYDFTIDDSAAYYGTVCSAFVCYALGIKPVYVTAAWADIPGMELIEDQSAYGLRVGDVMCRGDHTRLVTDIKRDSWGRIHRIELMDASPSKAKVRTLYCTAEKFHSWFIDVEGDKKPYLIYRYSKIHETQHTYNPIVHVEDEAVTDAVTYNENLMGRLGDRFNVRAGTDVVLDVLDKASYTRYKVLKDGKVLSTAVIPASGVITLTGLEYGKYSVCLTDGTSDSPAVEFIAVDTDIEIPEGTNAVRFRSANAKPLYLGWVTNGLNVCRIDELTADEVTNGERLFWEYPKNGNIQADAVWLAVETEYGVIISERVSVDSTIPLPERPEEPDDIPVSGDIPKALPNPYALTFTGGASGSYDGSKAVTVRIPQAGEAIPDYVRREAERVAAVVQGRQNANTLTFIAASDFHYKASDGQQKQSMTHMGQAMSLLRKMVHIDFTAGLGDMVWDNGETAAEGMAAMRFVSECLSGDGKQLRTRGNHDNLYKSGNLLTDGQIFANIGAWNAGAVFDSGHRQDGYCYLDFEDVKLRVILLNSAQDGSDAACYSTEQITWLSAALDLSTKGDGWSSIILSHHPLDWGRNDGGNPITAVNNASGLLASFHGHIHSFLSGTVTGTQLPRIGIPNACVGRENQYTSANGVNWGEAVTYGKTPETAEDTAFCVVTIDPDAKLIYADHYGAGYSRVISFGGTQVVSYTVTNKLTNVTTGNPGGTVSEGAAYSAALTAKAGYALTDVTVTMGGADITAAAYSNGRISIPSVTGNIVITAAAVAEETGPAYTNLVPTSIDTDGTVFNGKGYQEGYRLNSSGVTTGSAGAITSGFIPYKGQVIRVYGSADGNVSHNSNYVILYNSDFSKHTVQNFVNWQDYGAVWSNYNGRYLLTIDPQTITNAAAKAGLEAAAYIRCSLASCTGESFVVTLDEPIE